MVKEAQPRESAQTGSRSEPILAGGSICPRIPGFWGETKKSAMPVRAAPFSLSVHCSPRRRQDREGKGQ